MDQVLEIVGDDLVLREGGEERGNALQRSLHYAWTQHWP